LEKLHYLLSIRKHLSVLFHIDTECPKEIFPHRVTQNLDQYLKEQTDLKFDKDNIIELLKKSSIPEKKWFYNDLKSVIVIGATLDMEKAPELYMNVIRTVHECN
jgi:hypothetical protein